VSYHWPHSATVPPLLPVVVVVVAGGLVVLVFKVVPTEVVVVVPTDDVVVPPAQAPLIQNHARSTVSCTGTVCPTPTAEYPINCVPSP
jgi:hypothetical protein